MADNLDEILNGVVQQAPSTGPVSVQSGAGKDELQAVLDGITTPAAPKPPKVDLPSVVTLPALPTDSDPLPANPEVDTLLGAVNSSDKSYLGTLGELFAGGVKRNIAQFQAMPDMLGALYAESQGDTATAQAKARSAVDIQNAAGQPSYDLTKINNLEDFSYWLTEKLGENAATLGAMAFTGGVGGLTVGAATKTMVEKGLIKEATRRSAMIAGAAVPSFALSTSMETAGTGSEIFEATGKITPGLSVTAGMAKGALELWAPLSIAKSLISPGAVLGKTIPGAIGKIALKEGSTELAQESIDIAARKMMDPNYHFFDSGVEDWLSLKHPGLARLAEAGAAGFFTGGVYGAPFAGREKAVEQKPGDRTVLPGDPAAHGDPNFVDKIAGALNEPGPQAQITRPMLISATDKEQNFYATRALIAERQAEKRTLAAGLELNIRPSGGYVHYDVTEPDNPNPVGKFIVKPAQRKNAAGVEITNAWVDEKLRRQGIATAVYDIVDKDFAKVGGVNPSPASQLSTAAAAFWGKRLERKTVRPMLDFPAMAKGPISALRDLVLPPDKVKDVKAATAVGNPVDDIMGLAPVLRTASPAATVEKLWDMLDKNTQRFVIRRPDGKFDSDVMTSAEAELHNVVNYTQDTKPDYHLVNPRSLSPAGITARIFDIGKDGEAQDLSRVWFLPGVSTAEQGQLKMEYVQLVKELTGTAATALENTAGYMAIEDTFKPRYQELLDKGLRVLPTRGAGFYYGGAPMAADKFDLASTKRNMMVGTYDPKTRTFSVFTPTLGSGLRDRKLYEQTVLPTVVKNGIPVSIDLDKIDASKYKITPNGIVFDESVKLSQVTAGVDLTGANVGMFQDLLKLSGNVVSGETRVVNTWFETGPTMKTAERMEAVLNELVPNVKRILKQLDLDFNVVFEVTNQVLPGKASASPAWALIDMGVIYINPEIWEKTDIRSTGDFALDVRNVAMHELGHIVTLEIWKRMPLEMQQQLLYAFEKAHLARRMDAPTWNGERVGDMRAWNSVTVDTKGMPAVANYYYSLSEWLAEQFRRFTEATPHAENWQDSVLKKGSKTLESFYHLWEKTYGPDSAINLRNPDYYFSAMMEYFRTYSEDKQAFLNRQRQQELYYFDSSLVENPANMAVVKQVEAAILSMLPMFPANVSALVKERLESGISDRGFQSRAQAVQDYVSGLPSIELAFHAISTSATREDVRMTLTHELMHVFEMMGLVTKEELDILDAAIAKGPDPLGDPQKVAMYKRAYRSMFEDDRMTEFEIEAAVAKELARERRAFYLQEFARTGLSADQRATGIMARLLEVLERVRNYMNGLGYQSRDDLIRALFRGDIAKRAEERSAAKLKNGLRSGLQVDAEFQLDVSEYMFDKVEQAGKYTVGVSYDGGSVENKLQSKYISYIFFHPDGTQAGFVDLKNKMPKGFEIEMVNTKKGDGFSGMAFTNYVEQDLGIPMKLAGILLEDGFKQGMLFARKRAGIKDLRQFYQPVTRKDGTVQYYSPNKTREMVGLWTRIVAMMQTPEGVRTVNEQFADVLKQMVQPGATAVKMEERMTQKRAIAILASWKAFEKRFPPEVWTSPALEHMFQLERNVKRDGVLGAAVREGMAQNGAELIEALDGPNPAGRGPTAQEMYEEKLARYKADVAAQRGWDVRDVGEPMARTMFMLDTFKSAWQGAEGMWHEKAGTHPGRLNQHLGGQIQNMDRMNSFWKWTLTIKQLAIKNPNLLGLRAYVDHEDIMKQIAMTWVRRAEETARAWEGTGAKQREAISKAMFDFAEMRYRSSAEVQAKAVRVPRGWPQFLAGQPAALEVDTILRAAGVEKKNHRLVAQIARDFQDFLNEVERLRVAELQKTFANNPAELQAAMTKLAQEMGEFRAKPYFPMMRFGRFTAIVRDGTSGKIIWAAAYDNQAQRDAAVPEIRKQFPGDDITIGRASETAAELMGLPGPLLRIIREKLNADPATALTPQQEAEIQEFEVLNGPDTTFAKRWMPSQGMPGYSMDGFRAYANYFQNGSRYLARLAKMDDLKASIEMVNQTFRMGGIANFSKRQMIVDYMNAHYKYIMEPGQDSGKLRAFVSLWYLGFSVPSAMLNIMQIPTMTYPYLMKHFGRQVFPEFNTVLNAGKNTVRLRKTRNNTPVGDPGFLKAREEAIRQGIIDVGQAAELGGFAEGYNLHRLLAGDRTQKAWRTISWAGMYMFGFVEQYNRELTFNMAFNLAKKNPNVKAVLDIDSKYAGQVADLQARTGMSWGDAVAFLFAKETVDRTQFSYDKSADPQFMRGKRKDLLIFFKYTQNMLFALTHNGYGTAAHMLLLYMAIYGLQGLPGSEDLNELIRLLAKKLGFNLDFHQEARKMVRELTRGTILDQTGPDLFMHGIARYGMGPALFTEHYWPQFDVSANGSMGRIIPGMAELFHGMATDKKFADVFAESAQKASGAAYGMVFPLMKYLMEPPGTADSKKWEALLPRFAKGYVKAYRHGFDPGAETDSTGAKLVKFDINDIGDLMTVVTTAMGFQPRKVNEVYEALRETRDVMDYYQARRVALYAQLDKAIQVNDVQTIITVTTAMAKYNLEVQEAGYPTMSLKPNQIIQSLKQRATGRVMQENFLARNRSQIPVSQKILDMWPGIEQGKKVR